MLLLLLLLSRFLKLSIFPGQFRRGRAKERPHIASESFVFRTQTIHRFLQLVHLIRQ